MNKVSLKVVSQFSLALLYGTCAQAHNDYFDLSLSELTQITITSVSKREESVAESAAAVFVITQEDIRRSGATSIPDLLRMVPGVQVAQMDASDWAISVRGFNRQFSNKLLVMLDGRTVYTPLFSGVFWDAQQVMLEDIERIEVVRGPGGALWGANAVNGVINIISKSAADTQGVHMSALAGNQEQGVQLRKGGELGVDAYYRAYGKWWHHDEVQLAEGETGAGTGKDDEWRNGRVGFRADWAQSAKAFTLQGDAYQLRSDDRLLLDTLNAPFVMPLEDEPDARGINLLGRWESPDASGGQRHLQVYYDYEERENRVLRQQRHTLDLEFMQHLPARGRHRLIWGAGLRLMRDHLRETPIQGITYLDYEPAQRTDELVSAFVQDQISLSPGRLQLTLGSKFEHNEYTGFEVQPSARLAWNVKHGTVWGAVSRAVRTPTRGEHGLNLVAGVAPPGFVGLIKNEPGFDSEELLAYELGYRSGTGRHVNYDITVFYNDYKKLRTFEPVAPFGIFSIPLQTDNRARGEALGLEVQGTWQVSDTWRLSPGYSLLNVSIHTDTGSQDSLAELDEHNFPEQQFSLRSHWNVSTRWQLDSALYYVDRLSQVDSQGTRIPSYVRLDARLAWQWQEGVNLSLVGQNLLDGWHPEFGATLAGQRSEIPRSVFLQLSLDLD